MAHVLIVDDNQPVRDALRKALTDLGHSASGTGDMVHALDLIANHQPDLAVIDADMIFVEELLAAMAELLGHRWPPVLFTALGAVPPIPDATALVLTAVLRKPFTLTAFHDAVVELLAPAASP